MKKIGIILLFTIALVGCEKGIDETIYTQEELLETYNLYFDDILNKFDEYLDVDPNNIDYSSQITKEDYIYTEGNNFEPSINAFHLSYTLYNMTNSLLDDITLVENEFTEFVINDTLTIELLMDKNYDSLFIDFITIEKVYNTDSYITNEIQLTIDYDKDLLYLDGIYLTYSDGEYVKKQQYIYYEDHYSKDFTLDENELSMYILNKDDEFGFGYNLKAGNETYYHKNFDDLVEYVYFSVNGVASKKISGYTDLKTEEFSYFEIDNEYNFTYNLLLSDDWDYIQRDDFNFYLYSNNELVTGDYSIYPENYQITIFKTMEETPTDDDLSLNEFGLNTAITMNQINTAMSNEETTLEQLLIDYQMTGTFEEKVNYINSLITYIDNSDDITNILS